MEKFKLSNGVQIPSIGIGTFMLTPDQAEKSVYNALKCGCSLVDTANAYVNEKAVGRGMKKSGVPREKIFLSTKLWPTVYEEDSAVEKTLERRSEEHTSELQSPW